MKKIDIIVPIFNEESSILDFPALNIRESHERPEAMEEASVMMPGLNLEKVESCLKVLESQNINQKRILNIAQDYKSENVSEKIVRIILSYTDYVNKFIWKK